MRGQAVLREQLRRSVRQPNLAQQGRFTIDYTPAEMMAMHLLTEAIINAAPQVDEDHHLDRLEKYLRKHLERRGYALGSRGWQAPK